MTGGTDSRAQLATAVPLAPMFLPKITPPFNAQTGSLMAPNVFATAHMNSPWNPTLTQTNNVAKINPWMTSQPIEIEVVSDQQAQAPSMPKQQEVGKISWSSAEELADALFPKKQEQQQARNMHEGLLNHKEVLRQLQKRTNHAHDGLATHDHMLDGLQRHTELAHVGLLDHKNVLEKMQTQTQQMQSDMKAHINSSAAQFMVQEQRLNAHETRMKNNFETLLQSHKELRQSSLSNTVLEDLRKQNSELQNQHDQLRQDFVQQQRVLDAQNHTLSLHKDHLLQQKNEMLNIKSTQQTHNTMMSTMQGNDRYHTTNSQTQSSAIAALQRNYESMLAKTNVQKNDAMLQDLNARCRSLEMQSNDQGTRIDRLHNTIQQQKPADTHVHFSSVEGPRTRLR